MANSKRHAYLIIAHHQPELLKMLCHLLDHPMHDIFIHIGANSFLNPDDFKDITTHSPIRFATRTAVEWGGYSQINCELVMLKTSLAANSEGYGYYHLLSGVDMPLKTADEIYNFFESNKGKEFVQTGLGDDQWNEKIKNRINHYCIFQEKAGRDNKLWQKRQDKLRHWQYTLEIDRTKNLGKTILSGANWFSITHHLAQYVVSNEKWIKKHFNHSICADEVFLQTLINGTDFEQNLYHPMPQTEGAKACARYIDWKRGAPYTFTKADFDELINSGCMFARKFDIEKYPEICNKIYDYLLNK